ncbi:MAG: hypothetical protein OXK72_07410 [Gammaproteobacteria bacterium]|nr:hypothetical protein [Gammaproteobacteria bacterium]
MALYREFPAKGEAMGWLEIPKGRTRQRIHDTMAVITGIDEEATTAWDCRRPVPCPSRRDQRLLTPLPPDGRPETWLDRNKEAENGLA